MNKIRNWEDLVAVVLRRCYDDGAWVRIIKRVPWLTGKGHLAWSKNDKNYLNKLVRVVRYAPAGEEKEHYYRAIDPLEVREPFKENLRHNRTKANVTILHGRFLLPAKSLTSLTPPKIKEVCIRAGQIK